MSRIDTFSCIRAYDDAAEVVIIKTNGFNRCMAVVNQPESSEGKSMEDSDDEVPIFGTRTDEQKAIEALNMLETPLGNAKLCFKGVTRKE